MWDIISWFYKLQNLNCLMQKQKNKNRKQGAHTHTHTNIQTSMELMQYPKVYQWAKPTILEEKKKRKDDLISIIIILP